MHNIAEPGSYNRELNKLLKANKLPQVIVPDNPPSLKILNMANSENKTNEEHVEEEIQEEQENQVVEEEVEEEMPELEKISGKEIGLQIITKQSEGWPRETINITHVLNALERNHYKYIYTDQTYTDEKILRLLKNNEINMEQCWKVMDDQTFRKVRNGLTKEHTPPQGSKQKLKTKK